MTKWIIGVLTFAFWTTASCAQTTFVERKNVRPNELLVKFKPAVSLAGVDASSPRAAAMFAAGNGSALRVIDLLPESNVAVLQVGGDTAPVAADGVETMNMNQVMTSLQESNDQIEFVQPNYVYYASQAPNDPSADQLRFVDIIGLEDAWRIRTDASDIVVAVIDTGVLHTHPDLVNNIWVNQDETEGDDDDDDGNGFTDDVHGFDFANDESDPTAALVSNAFSFFGFCLNLAGNRFEEHGTHVSGTIGASGNNDRGITGVAWNVQIMPLKFLDGPCGQGDTVDAIRAIDYAAENGAHIINCSWGGGAQGDDIDQLLRESIQFAGEEDDVLVVAAAGNEDADNDQTPSFPANFSLPNLISVGASTDADTKADFSNYGEETVDLFAPGVNIHSTIPTGSMQPAGSGFGNLSGTSMAAPIVSGVAALVRAEFPFLSANEVKQWLMSTVDEVDDLEELCVTGGRLNAATALTTPRLPDPSDLGPAGPAITALAASEQEEIKQLVTTELLFKMVLKGGMPLVKSKPAVAQKGKPVEVLIAFDREKVMDTTTVKEHCLQSFDAISEVEVVSKRSNSFRIRGESQMSLEELKAAIQLSRDVRIVQPNFQYRQ